MGVQLGWTRLDQAFLVAARTLRKALFLVNLPSLLDSIKFNHLQSPQYPLRFITLHYYPGTFSTTISSHKNAPFLLAEVKQRAEAHEKLVKAMQCGGPVNLKSLLRFHPDVNLSLVTLRWHQTWLAVKYAICRWFF